MDKLSKVIEKRSSVRSSVTKLVKRFETLDESSKDFSTLSELLELLEAKEEVLKKYDLEVEDLISDPEKFKSELKSSEEYDDKILSAKIKLRNKIKQLNPANVQRSHSSNSSSSIIESSATALKLPKLEIARFSGDSSNFTEFFNCFESAIGSNGSLSKIEKFQYLKSLLSGPAYNVVAGFELNEKNYDSCIELLKQRYGRTDYIINSYMTKLLNLEPVKNSSHVKGLRKLYDEIEVNIRNLRALNVTEGSYGHLLNPLLMKLLPQDLVLDFQRKRDRDAGCEVSEILTFLRNEVESREICETIMSSPKSYESKRTFPQNFKSDQTYQRNYSKNKNVSTAAALNTQIKTVCLFCNGNHDSINCKKSDIEQKINKLKFDGRCWCCFKRNHLSRDCRAGVICNKCSNKFHHGSVCRKKGPQNSSVRAFDRQNGNRSNEPNSDDSDSNNNVEGISVSHSNCTKNKAFLQTCSIFACSDKKSVLTNVILDNASHKSFISAELVKELNLKPIRYEKLAIFSFGQTTASERRYPVVSLTLQNRDDRSKSYKLEALVTEFISNLSLNTPDDSLLEEVNARGLKLADSYDNRTRTHILVGSDAFWDIVYDERVKLNGNMSAINSCFGWLLAGVGKNNASTDSCENVCLIMDSSSILFDLRKFWETEELQNEKQDLSERDNQLIEKFENSLKFNGERYVCKLLWKENMGPAVGLDSNYEVAKKRFNSLSRKLNRNPEIFEEYKQIVSDQLSSNIVGKTVDSDTNSGYYMPHRAVIRDDKETTRVRIVYDCSSKANENKKSLNESLESGVNLYTNLINVILKFREHQVAFCGDLEKAFLMIEIAEEDREYLKFLWFPEGSDDSTQTLHLNRLPFGLTTSPFALACVLKFHIKKFKDLYPKSYEMLNSFLYVDDLFYGAKNPQDAYELTSKAIELLSSAGFNLRKLKTNCPQLNELWRKNGYVKNTDFGHGTGFLGLTWNPDEDTIQLNLRDVRDSVESGITKRYVLRVISRIFDPCGMISPFVITVKILLQEIWTLGLKWDEELPSDLQKKWKTWCAELNEMTLLKIDRKLFSCGKVNDVSLHVFCDASPKAYGAVAYFRYVDINGQFKVTFIMSKCKVAPLKTLTLPRLELMAALIAARLGNYLKGLFPDFSKQIYLWSDSQIVLHWLKGSAKNWKPFVSNRVAQVQSLTPPECWNHCSGSDNPADLTTRGESARKILTSSLWWTGPTWLCQPAHSWPVQGFANSTEGFFNEDVIGSERRTAIVNAVISSSNGKNMPLPLIDVNRFSSLSKLLRVTAWIKRFSHNAKKGSLKLNGPISASELQEALQFCIKTVQLQHFGVDVVQLLSKGTVDKSSRLFNLSPELDDKNLLHLKGRLQFSNDVVRAKHPWLLPNNDKFVELLIFDAHSKMCHSGVDATLTHLREQFWIIKGRQFVKKVLKNCLICRRYSVKPGTQTIAPLPPDRIQEHPPFDVCGVDFAGPFFVNDYSEKCYLLIFTCAVTRAIHLELVLNLSTDSFLLGFRRFISRRGLCSVIYSDNAKAFKKANCELKNWWNQINNPDVKNMFASKGIVWKFIVEKSPWWGGFWERQIRTVKTCLKKIIGRASLSLKELETVFLEIEAMVNSRPITYLYNELSEPSPLTPSHFLIGKRLMALPETKHKSENLIVNRNSLVKKVRYQQTLLDHFWNRWRKEYLLNLRSAYISPPTGKVTSFKVNDIILINDERYPRNMWMMGKILEVYPGRDGNIRSLLIKTPKGNIKRSVQLVYNLEINS